MSPPPLKLAFVKGPREGETLEYKPGSTIRIGRVVRGNEIAIKDAGISTKHIRIVSDSENWIIHDLGSSNGTTLNSESLDADTPVTLRQGDEIKLGEYTSIVVSFETDVQEEEEPKLPPRPRRNTRRLPVADPDPVQEKPTRKGRSARQEEPEPPKRTTRATKEAEESVPVEKKGKSRARGGRKNAEDVLNSIKLEVEEDTPKGVEMSAMKRVTRSSRKIGNAKSEEDTSLEEMRIPSRATRSKRKEVGGDSYLDLDMVLSQARAKKKKVEQKSVVEEMEATNKSVEGDKEDERGVSEPSDKEDEAPKRVEIESRKSTLGEEDVEEDKENEKEDVTDTSDKDDQTSKKVEVESGKSSLGEEDLNCSVKEDGEEENLPDTSDGGCDEEEEESRNVEKVDLEKMTLGDWFKYMEVYLRKKIVDETEEMIEGMRAKSRRVHQYIAEQKGKEKDV
ncbi:SMAD/FHA domain-containing protein [Raphanus sativus]|uniref:FHA domain-containing protein At4g14490 n=1 Tax=Raphanus sativus TaxID=3726 RepID=A0A6J0NSH9_RAPSA|nr:FHA domain-containing protein At4g14490 [Raphanus sativus]KAJ4898598.1 SMAD/FHA domain-containing protein [Raphanus sativus]